MSDQRQPPKESARLLMETQTRLLTPPVWIMPRTAAEWLIHMTEHHGWPLAVLNGEGAYPPGSPAPTLKDWMSWHDVWHRKMGVREVAKKKVGSRLTHTHPHYEKDKPR